MKTVFTYCFALFILSACPQNNEVKPIVEQVEQVEIPEVNMSFDSLVYDRTTSIWMYYKEAFSGYVIKRNSNGNVVQKFATFQGRKQNGDTTWYENGIIKSLANYHKGKLHGEKKMWNHENNTQLLVAHLQYKMGKLHGEQRKWYPSGELFKVLNLNMGKEEGMQKAYRKNGALYANYEAKNGRIFGMRKAALCYGLDDEEVIK